eukprot:2899721-Prorocentrum_lima.AAC.1
MTQRRRWKNGVREAGKAGKAAVGSTKEETGGPTKRKKEEAGRVAGKRRRRWKKGNTEAGRAGKAG